MKIDRFQIRQEYDLLQSVLNEQFLKASDPTLSVLDFIETISNHMGHIKRLYAVDARNRNAAIPEIKKEVHAIVDACHALEQAMRDTEADPEDTNTVPLKVAD